MLRLYSISYLKQKIMAQTQTNQEEDLLIISDDSSETEISLDDNSIELSLDDTTPEVQKEETIDLKEEVIDLSVDSSEAAAGTWVEAVEAPTIEISEAPQETDTETQSQPIELDTMTVEDTTPEEPAQAPEEVVAETGGLDLGLWNMTDTSSESASTEEVEQAPAQEETPAQEMWALDFGLDDTPAESETATTESQEAVSETESSNMEEEVTAEDSKNEESMNDILSATITKLETRKEDIKVEKDGKHAQVKDIEDQIEALQKEKQAQESAIEELTSEEKKITTNIKWLEKMKLDEEVAKEHNSKRVPKK